MENKCPACGQKEVLSLEEINLDLQHALYAVGNKNVQIDLTKAAKSSAEKYTMLKCKTCELEYADPLIAPSTDWYSLAYKTLSLYPSDRWEFNYVLDHLDSTKIVGEFGCGSGFFLKKCISKGIECEGYDFSQEVIDEGKINKLPMTILNLSDPNLDEINEGQKFDVFTSFHVLEHLDNPCMLFQLAHNLSNDNSNLWISIPSDRRLTRIFNERDFLDQPPHHLSRWNPSSLDRIGSENGWHLEKVVYEPINLKTILWSYSTRFSFYEKINSQLNNIWISRLFRYSIYPLALLQWIFSRDKITGFSVLSKYTKININLD